MGQNLDSMKQQKPRSKAELLYDIVLTTGNVEAIKALFQDGASLEGRKNSLMLACMNRNLFDAAKTLIELGANINAYRPGCRAGTSSHHAANEGLVKTVELLLSNGANTLVRNNDCQTPLDVARQNQHVNVVRAIEKHICYFSGWVRKISGAGFIEGVASCHLSRKIWVVVLPHGPNDPTKPLMLELAVYSTLKLKLASTVQDDKQQLQALYNACRGIVQVMPSPTSQTTQTSVESAELASDSNQSASAGILPAPNSHPIPDTSNTNGWGTSVNDDSYKGWGSAFGTKHSEAKSSGWINEQVKEDHNGWSALGHEPQPLGNQTKHSQTCRESNASVSEENNVLSSPSAPFIPEEILAEGPICYPSLDLGEDASSPPTNSEASASNSKKAGGDSSSCVICWQTPIEGTCIPCGHMAGCMSCLNEIKAKNGVCPICRSKMNGVVRIYTV